LAPTTDPIRTRDTKVEGGFAFERPILEMEQKITELKRLAASTRLDLNGEIVALEDRLKNVTREIYTNLTAWERISVARHPDRPATSDYVHQMLDDFVELCGDRLYADDGAIVTGLASMDKFRFMLVGHRKGSTVKERLACNFGCAHPEGYRKALAKMRLAERMRIPIVTLINTPGAYPASAPRSAVRRARSRSTSWRCSPSRCRSSRSSSAKAAPAVLLASASATASASSSTRTTA
jgi:acetyl-CoA carboxylase carboxyl transferase alpha subunit